MQKKYLLPFILLAIVTKSAFSSNITIYNKTNTPIEVEARFGSQGATITKRIIKNNKSASFGSVLHGLQSLQWRSTNEGVYHSIQAPSSRFMSSGHIEIYPRGYFITNFNHEGMLKNKLVYVGNASSEKTNYRQANATYDQAQSMIIQNLR